MMSIVVVMGFAICFLYWWTNNFVPLPERSIKKKVPTPSLSLCVILSVLSNNDYSNTIA
jgi:AAA family ATP:ADP antiporter